MLEIKYIDNKDTKEGIVRDILLNLPEWFGLEDSTEEYITHAREYKLICAFNNDEPIGFVSLKETSLDTLEVYCMGVLKKYHNQGIGTKLLDEIKEDNKNLYHFLQVKTVNENHYKEYDQTIQFYKKNGFFKLEVFPTLWDAHNPCLIMVLAL